MISAQNSWRATPRRFGPLNWLGLFTLIEREARRGLKDYNYQILGPVVSSLLYLIVFHLALRTNSDITNTDLLAFIVPGLVIFVACEKAFECAATSFIFDKHERIIADVLMAPLSACERVCGYLGGCSIAGVVVGIAVALVTLFFADLRCFHIGAILFFGLMGIMLHGLIGILVGIWAEKWDSYTAVHTFLLLPLSFLSGLFYRIENLPEAAQALVRFNPIFYVIDGFRFGLTNTHSADPRMGAFILVFSNSLLFILTYIWFRRGYRLKP